MEGASCWCSVWGGCAAAVPAAGEYCGRSMGSYFPPRRGGDEGTGVSPPGRLGLGTFVPRPSRFWQSAKICRCGGLMEREGKPYGFPSHILSLSRARKVSKSALRGTGRRTLAPPQAGHSPYARPPKNHRTRRSFGRPARRFGSVLRTRRRWFLLSRRRLESVPPSLDLLWAAAAALPASLDLPPKLEG